MKPGTVLFFKDFKFKDGSSKDKLLIVLNQPRGEEPYLLCTTTSRKRRRKKELGCHAKENYFYIDQDQDGFIKNTWVVFHIVYAFSAPALVSSNFKGKLYQSFDLEPSLWTALKHCILQSMDIDQDYLELIERG